MTVKVVEGNCDEDWRDTGGIGQREGGGHLAVLCVCVCARARGVAAVMGR